MHAPFVVLTLLTLPIFSLAASIPRGGPTCSTGEQQCCNHVQNVQNLDRGLEAFLSLIQVDVSQLTGSVGVQCDPVAVLGVSGQSCNQQTVCCDRNNFNGLVALGCNPVNGNA
ncbi:hypothetical protein AMATHDRAFT_63114 [Amanita thiersii Skay4041]|uniref:Hydrophobin n=1 Tax=Amanita thiersii Skay4041 TaxID=703135 RepID=A0A2A9NHG9_9AGAR|nr:hypothetical protein AMATHDRAFT_63114 [Amanita thiersii Skay4041]